MAQTNDGSAARTRKVSLVMRHPRPILLKCLVGLESPFDVPEITITSTRIWVKTGVICVKRADMKRCMTTDQRMPPDDKLRDTRHIVAVSAWRLKGWASQVLTPSCGLEVHLIANMRWFEA
jgi:hypothetical protein